MNVNNFQYQTQAFNALNKKTGISYSHSVFTAPTCDAALIRFSGTKPKKDATEKPTQTKPVWYKRPGLKLIAGAVGLTVGVFLASTAALLPVGVPIAIVGGLLFLWGLSQIAKMQNQKQEGLKRIEEAQYKQYVSDLLKDDTVKTEVYKNLEGLLPQNKTDEETREIISTHLAKVLVEYDKQVSEIAKPPLFSIKWGENPYNIDVTLSKEDATQAKLTLQKDPNNSLKNRQNTINLYTASQTLRSFIEEIASNKEELTKNISLSVNRFFNDYSLEWNDTKEQEWYEKFMPVDKNKPVKYLFNWYLKTEVEKLVLGQLISDEQKIKQTVANTLWAYSFKEGAIANTDIVDALYKPKTSGINFTQLIQELADGKHTPADDIDNVRLRLLQYRLSPYKISDGIVAHYQKTLDFNAVKKAFNQYQLPIQQNNYLKLLDWYKVMANIVSGTMSRSLEALDYRLDKDYRLKTDMQTQKEREQRYDAFMNNPERPKIIQTIKSYANDTMYEPTSLFNPEEALKYTAKLFSDVVDGSIAAATAHPGIAQITDKHKISQFLKAKINSSDWQQFEQRLREAGYKFKPKVTLLGAVNPDYINLTEQEELVSQLTNDIFEAATKKKAALQNAKSSPRFLHSVHHAVDWGYQFRYEDLSQESLVQDLQATLGRHADNETSPFNRKKLNLYNFFDRLHQELNYTTKLDDLLSCDPQNKALLNNRVENTLKLLLSSVIIEYIEFDKANANNYQSTFGDFAFTEEKDTTDLKDTCTKLFRKMFTILHPDRFMERAKECVILQGGDWNEEQWKQQNKWDVLQVTLKDDHAALSDIRDQKDGVKKYQNISEQQRLTAALARLKSIEARWKKYDPETYRNK